MKRLLHFVFLFLLFSPSLSQEVAFTQEDRERLIRLEATLKTFMEQVDKRFEQIDKRFEQVDKRFEQIDKELDRLVNIMIAIFGGQIALVAAVIAFAWWDRRTIISEAKRQTIEELERDIKPESLRKLIRVLQEKAKTDKELEKLLKDYGLMK